VAADIADIADIKWPSSSAEGALTSDPGDREATRGRALAFSKPCDGEVHASSSLGAVR
jgi:hypothetical protein